MVVAGHALLIVNHDREVEEVNFYIIIEVIFYPSGEGSVSVEDRLRVEGEIVDTVFFYVETRHEGVKHAGRAGRRNSQCQIVDLVLVELEGTRCEIRGGFAVVDREVRKLGGYDQIKNFYLNTLA